MKRTQKAIKLSLLYAAACCAVLGNLKAEALQPEAPEVVVTPALVVAAAIKAQVAEVTVVEAPVVEAPVVTVVMPEGPAPVVETPVERVIKIFKPFFTDTNYKVTESFKAMCFRAVAILRESTDPGIRQVADFLEQLCKKNHIMIAFDLQKNQAILKPYVDGHRGKALAQSVLLTRLKEAVNFKD